MDPVVKAPEGFVLPTQWKFLYCITAPVLKPMEKKVKTRRTLQFTKTCRRVRATSSELLWQGFSCAISSTPLFAYQMLLIGGFPQMEPLNSGLGFIVSCLESVEQWNYYSLPTSGRLEDGAPMTWSMGFFMGFFGGGNQKHWLMAVFKDRCICLLKKGRVFQLQFIVPKIRGWFSGRFD